MPKSKVRKTTSASSSPSRAAQATANASLRAKVAAPSSPIYLGIMLGLFLLGLAWLVVYYLARESIPFLNDLGSWNFAISFGLLIAGLIMTMRWR